MSNDESVNTEVMKRAFALLEATYYGMPVQEYYDDNLENIISTMTPEAVEFFAALTAATTLAITLLSDTERAKFFAVGESC